MSNSNFLRRIRDLYSHSTLYEFWLAISQKIQRRVIWYLLLGSNHNKRRVRKCFIDNLDRGLSGKLLSNDATPKKLLEIGCGRGRDFLAYFDNDLNYELYGLDLKKRSELDRLSNLQFILGDAEEIPYPDNYFDIGVSIGVLEHITPIEKLGRVLAECDRVCKSHAHIVPSVSTLWEAHTGVFRWQIYRKERKVQYEAPLIFMTDEAWLSFEPLKEASSFRFYSVPLLVSNLLFSVVDSGSQCQTS